jgi:predicted small lipoprotein YifL
MIRFFASAGVILVMFALAGCRQEPQRPPTAGPAAATADAGHEHEAPHKGTLLELGEEFAHVELVRDAAAGTLTAYVLDGEADVAVRLSQRAIGIHLEAPVTRSLTLGGRGNPLTGEQPDDTSQFVVTDDVFKGAGPFNGVILAVTVRGSTFTDVPFVLTQ